MSKAYCTLTTLPRPSAEEATHQASEPSNNVVVLDWLPAEKPRGRFTPLSLSELSDLPPPSWTVDGLLEAGSIALLYGDTNIGKSFAALDIALHIGAGLPWQGRAVQAGQAVYVYTESPRGLPPRVEAWEAEHGIEARDLWVIRDAPAMSEQSDVSQLIRAIRSTCPSPSIIVLDTLSRTFGAGDENSAEDMAKYLRGCDELRTAFPNAVILVIHHTGKDPKKGARGSYMLVANVDTVFKLKRTATGLVLDNEKQRNGEQAKPLRLALVKPFTNLPPVIQSGSYSLAELAAAEPKDKRQSQTDAAILQALADAGSKGLTFTEVWQAAGIVKQTAITALKRLASQGMVGKIGDRYIQVK